MNRRLALVLLGCLLCLIPYSSSMAAESMWPDQQTLSLVWEQSDLTLVGIMAAGVSSGSRHGLIANLSFTDPLIPQGAFTDNTTDIWWLCIVKSTPMSYSNWSLTIGADYNSTDWPDAESVNCSGPVSLGVDLVGVLLITSQLKGSNVEMHVASWIIGESAPLSWGAVAVLAIFLVALGVYLVSRRLFFT